ncbi:hypothetical protein NQD34_009465 [Periophthalmus magnuspinnatus]|nr:hypothetical protein NQD34_009465 [Periophthalmus magnuspinnatus]
MSAGRNKRNSFCERCRNYQQQIIELQARIFVLESQKGLHQTLPVTSSGKQPTVTFREESEKSATFNLNLSDTMSFPKLCKDKNFKPTRQVIRDNANIVTSPKIQLTNRFLPLSQTDVDVNIQTENGFLSQNKSNEVGKRAAADRRSVPNVKVRDTLLLGDGAIRDVTHRGIQTCSYPSHTVSEITKLLPKVLSTHQGAKQLIVHVGAVDTRMNETEILKKHFIELFEELDKVEVKTFISGPLPTIDRRKMNKFTRLLQLNTWLFNECAARGLHYIENFDLFLETRGPVQGNGPHLSRGGVRVLTDNLLHALRNRPGQGPGPVREKRNERSIPAAPTTDQANVSAPPAAPQLQPPPPPGRSHHQQHNHLPQRRIQLHHHLPKRTSHPCPQTNPGSPLLHPLPLGTPHSPFPPHLHLWPFPTI